MTEARRSRNQNWEYLAQRCKRRKDKAYCHFDQREKSFSDPSHSLGMTGLARHLAFPAALLRECLTFFRLRSRQAWRDKSQSK
jgi:hypothetical protein